MGFLTPALLAGAALVAVPIALHLIMRREAKHLAFPALRFVERRRTLNQHRLRLRHLLLLALRCAIIVLLAVTLARPVLRAGAGGKDERPIATVLVFDNSLRLEYQQENETRLERAKELAVWLLGQLQDDSPVTVIDRAGRQRGQLLDRDAAELIVQRLELSAATRPPDEPLRDAADWLHQESDYRGEVYLFTDLSEEAWPDDVLASFARRLDELPGTNVYLIDVGAEQPKNVALGELQLSDQQLGKGESLRIETNVARTSTPADDRAETMPGATDDGRDVTVELYVVTKGGAAEKRGQQVVQVSPAAPTPVEFSLAGLALGTHQGYLRIVGGDALPCDDVRYFTVEVRPASKLLLLGETPTDTLFLREALAPTNEMVPTRFDCTVGSFDLLSNSESPPPIPVADQPTSNIQHRTSNLQYPISSFDAICLIDPPPLPSDAWSRLTDYVEGGGGLGVFLGRRAKSSDFNAEEPQWLLPAQLRWVSHETTYLRPIAIEHPVLTELGELTELAPWSEFPVFKYWELASGAEGVYVVATYANGKPALVERQVDRGRVLLMTTSISDPAHDDPWNVLPTGPEPWPFLALANSIAQYLVGTSDERLNYLAGQSAVLRFPPEGQTSQYVLQMPDGTRERTTTLGRHDISITSTEAPGNYRVQAGGAEGTDRGFSVNVPIGMSRLERTTPERIAAALGSERVRTARTRQEIEVRVTQGRVGRELFPAALILAVALVLGAEHWLANRFYRGESRAERQESKAKSGAPALNS